MVTRSNNPMILTAVALIVVGASESAADTIHVPDDAPTIQTLVLNTPLAPDFYEGNLTFELPARYTLRVDVDSPTFGSTSFRAPLTVRSGTPIENPLGTWIFLLVTFAIIGGTVYVGFSAKKAQRRRAAA